MDKDGLCSSKQLNIAQNTSVAQCTNCINWHHHITYWQQAKEYLESDLFTNPYGQPTNKP